MTSPMTIPTDQQILRHPLMKQVIEDIKRENLQRAEERQAREIQESRLRMQTIEALQAESNQALDEYEALRVQMLEVMKRMIAAETTYAAMVGSQFNLNPNFPPQIFDRINLPPLRHPDYNNSPNFSTAQILRMTK